MNDIVLVTDHSIPCLSWRKGKIEKLIYGDGNLVRRADVCVYQDGLGKTIVIRRPLQLLVLSEITNIIHNDNEVNGPANKRPRLVSLDADLIPPLSVLVNPNSYSLRECEQ